MVQSKAIKNSIKVYSSGLLYLLHRFYWYPEPKFSVLWNLEVFLQTRIYGDRKEALVSNITVEILQNWFYFNSNCACSLWIPSTYPNSFSVSTSMFVKLASFRWQRTFLLVLSPCFHSKHGCFGPRKRVLSLQVLIGIFVDIYKKCFIFHSEALEIESSQFRLFFSIIEHAGY